jgi:hypothetical protein
MSQIDVLIDKDGNVEVQTKGFSGPDCKKATADLERELGKTTGDTLTPEYHHRVPVTQKARG